MVRSLARRTSICEAVHESAFSSAELQYVIHEGIFGLLIVNDVEEGSRVVVPVPVAVSVRIHRQRRLGLERCDSIKHSDLIGLLVHLVLDDNVLVRLETVEGTRERDISRVVGIFKIKLVRLVHLQVHHVAQRVRETLLQERSQVSRVLIVRDINEHGQVGLGVVEGEAHHVLGARAHGAVVVGAGRGGASHVRLRDVLVVDDHVAGGARQGTVEILHHEVPVPAM